MPRSKYQWHFPPRNQGVEVINEPSSAFFKDNPIVKLVREVIQNSLDAHEPGIHEPVSVAFTDTEVERSIIGASQLYRHLSSCLNRAKTESEALQDHYAGAVETLKNPHIRCLRITDTNTTGLKGKRWDALVTQEGSVQKSDTGAPGGSFGIGKNAVFNVSDIQTVFYSTHYLEGRKGRVDKLQGKATLMAHPDPDDSSESLQHIGFFTDSKGEPIIGGGNVDDFFQLSEPGTGVYIMGFNPRVEDWVGDIIRAVLQNFFYAIHHQSLVVSIDTEEGETQITRENLELLFNRFNEDTRNSYGYYRAIRDAEAVSTKSFPVIGSLDIFINLEGGPKRMAFVTRNGMLISDSKEKKDNPIPPRNRTIWPDYAAVVMPSTDGGDSEIRKMENPSHDAISPAQLRTEAEQKKMWSALLSARRAIQDIMDERTHLAQSGNQANLRELAEMFPELDPSKEGVTSLITRQITPSNTGQSSFEELDSDSDGGNEDIIDPDSEGESGGDREGTQAGTNNPNNQTGNQGNTRGQGTHGTRGSRVSLRNVRVVSTDPNTVVVALNPIGNAPHLVKFALSAAGEEFQNVGRIQIESAKVRESAYGVEVDVKDDVVSLSLPETERSIVEIKTSESVANLAFRMRVQA